MYKQPDREYNDVGTMVGTRESLGLFQDVSTRIEYVCSTPTSTITNCRSRQAINSYKAYHFLPIFLTHKTIKRAQTSVWLYTKRFFFIKITKLSVLFSTQIRSMIGSSYLCTKYEQQVKIISTHPQVITLIRNYILPMYPYTDIAYFLRKI